MADRQLLVNTSAHHVTYINSIFTNFISGIADYLRVDVFPRAKDTIISTHNKSAEMVRTRKNLASENWSPKFPFLVVQPSMDIRPDPVLGRRSHNYPNMNKRFASQLYTPYVYEDENIYIAPVLNRYVGTIDCILWCGSVYEAIDQRIQIIQAFGGEGFYIHPRNLECMLIIPESLENHVYENKYTEESYALDWSGSRYQPTLIRNLNRNRLAATVTLAPFLKLANIDDATEAFGGSGNSISDHRVSVQLEWECNIPTHMVLVEKKLPLPSVAISIDNHYKFSYIPNPVDVDELIYIPDDRFSSSVLTSDISGGTVQQKFLQYDKSENYIITSEDVLKFENNENLYITPNQEVLDSRYIKAHAKYGWLEEPLHYDIKDGNIVLYGMNMKLMVIGDIITFLYYKDGDI